MRKLVVLAWETDGESVDEFYYEMQRRPLSSEPVVAVKALVTALRLLQQGPRAARGVSFKLV